MVASVVRPRLPFYPETRSFANSDPQRIETLSHLWRDRLVSSRGRLHHTMKILYKPFALIAGVIAARIGKTVFKSMWSRIDDSEPPEPTVADASLPKVVGAAALEAATMAGVAAAVDRASARSFHYLTGIWPGKQTTEESDEKE